MEIEHTNQTVRRNDILGIDRLMGCVLSTVMSLLCTCMTIFTIYPSVL